MSEPEAFTIVLLGSPTTHWKEELVDRMMEARTPVKFLTIAQRQSPPPRGSTEMVALVDNTISLVNSADLVIWLYDDPSETALIEVGLLAGSGVHTLVYATTNSSIRDYVKALADRLPSMLWCEGGGELLRLALKTVRFATLKLTLRQRLYFWYKRWRIRFAVDEEPLRDPEAILRSQILDRNAAMVENKMKECDYKVHSLAFLSFLGGKRVSILLFKHHPKEFES